MIETAHPDIQLFSTRPALPRREPARRIEEAPGWSMPARAVPIEPAMRAASGRPVLVN
jgi:hypothetical protein